MTDYDIPENNAEIFANGERSYHIKDHDQAGCNVFAMKLFLECVGVPSEMIECDDGTQVTLFDGKTRLVIDSSGLGDFHLHGYDVTIPETSANIFPAPSGVDEIPPVAPLPADHGITLWGVGAMDAAGGAPELQWDIEIPCQKCDGTGDVECCESGQSLECPACAGEGTLQDLADFKIPEKHKNREEMERIILDHNKCHYDHKKLCRLNPRAKESYGAQLTATVAKLTEALKALI